MKRKPTTMLSRALGKTAMIVFAVLSIWNAPALAQDSPPAPAAAQAAAVDPERLALAREMLRASDVQFMRRDLDASLDAFAQRVTQDWQPNIKRLHASMITAFDAVAPELLDSLSAAYAQNLTTQELRDTLSFYHSPSGQAFLQKRPTMRWDVFALREKDKPGTHPQTERLTLAREMLATIKVKSSGLPDFLTPPEERISADAQRELDELMVASYAKNLTEQEMKDTLVFYRSPSGQSSQIKILEVKRQAEPTVNSIMAKLLETAQADYCAHHSCDGGDEDLFEFMQRNFDSK